MYYFIYFSTILSTIFQSQSVEYYHILYYIIVKISYDENSYDAY